MSESFKEIKTKGKIPTYKYLVDGEWQESRSRRIINIFSPIDDSLLGRIYSLSPKEIDIAITAASLAQPNWASLSLAERAAILKKAGRFIKENSKTLAELLTLETGKTKKEAEYEIEHGLYLIQEIIKEQAWAGEEKVKIDNEVCKIKRVPRGVIVCITPFNYPIYTSLSKLVPALISGNAVVLKPSATGTISVLHLAQLFKKAGIPDGVLNVITGQGKALGKYLIPHRLVNMVTFTGSTRTGRDVARRAEITKLSLELGGKDAAIVLRDADLEKAALEIVRGAFSYAGQRCVAIKRVLVESEIKDELVKKLKKEVEKNYSQVGDPRNLQTQLGPVITNHQANYLSLLLNDALKKGAKIVIGGKRFGLCPVRSGILGKIWRVCRGKGRGKYWQATILENVKTNMKIAWEEQFGPILPVITIEDENEAIKIINASNYGLDAAIFTKNLDKAESIADKLEVGQVFINSRPKRFPDQFPFTGVKDSGLETEGISQTIEAMTTPKATRV